MCVCVQNEGFVVFFQSPTPKASFDIYIYYIATCVSPSSPPFPIHAPSCCPASVAAASLHLSPSSALASRSLDSSVFFAPAMNTSCWYAPRSRGKFDRTDRDPPWVALATTSASLAG